MRSRPAVAQILPKKGSIFSVCRPLLLPSQGHAKNYPHQTALECTVVAALMAIPWSADTATREAVSQEFMRSQWKTLLTIQARRSDFVV